MRRSTVLQDIAGMRPHDHAIWTLEDTRQLVNRCLPFINEGLERDERVICVFEGAAADRLDGLDRAARLVLEGRLRLRDVSEVYGDPFDFDPSEQLEVFSAELEEALLDGHSGIRVLADNTSLASEPELFDRWLEWEHTADRFISQNQVSGVCVFDLQRLQADRVDDLLALHPVVTGPVGPLPMFRMFDEDEAVVFLGEIDTFSAGQLERLLSALPRSIETVIVDLGQVSFINHSGMLALCAVAQRGTRIVLRNPPRTALRLIEAVGPPMDVLEMEATTG